jgi:hypothetical protein
MYRICLLEHPSVNVLQYLKGFYHLCWVTFHFGKQSRDNCLSAQFWTVPSSYRTVVSLKKQKILIFCLLSTVCSPHLRGGLGSCNGSKSRPSCVPTKIIAIFFRPALIFLNDKYDFVLLFVSAFLLLPNY